MSDELMMIQSNAVRDYRMGTKTPAYTKTYWSANTKSGIMLAPCAFNHSKQSFKAVASFSSFASFLEMPVENPRT